MTARNTRATTSAERDLVISFARRFGPPHRRPPRSSATRSQPTTTTDRSWAFAAFKNHCGFYVMSPSVMDAHKDPGEGVSGRGGHDR